MYSLVHYMRSISETFLHTNLVLSIFQSILTLSCFYQIFDTARYTSSGGILVRIPVLIAPNFPISSRIFTIAFSNGRSTRLQSLTSRVYLVTGKHFASYCPDDLTSPGIPLCKAFHMFNHFLCQFPKDDVD